MKYTVIIITIDRDVHFWYSNSLRKIENKLNSELDPYQVCQFKILTKFNNMILRYPPKYDFYQPLYRLHITQNNNFKIQKI